MPDVIVIGGGVIGLASAYELAGRGLDVTVLERQQPGQEASWAGAGILPPGQPGDPQHPLAKLCAATHPLWPALSQALHEQTGIDNGFRQCGGLNVSPDADAAARDAEINDWTAAGVNVQRLTADELNHLEPAIGPAAGPGYRVPDTWQVRNPRHVKALIVACIRRGVDIRSGAPVEKIETIARRVSSVQTATDRYSAAAYLVTAGPWTQQVLQSVGPSRELEPVRGQIVLLSTPVPLVQHVIECGPRYIVPRSDGRTLIGSTEEWVGFQKQNTPMALRSLMDFALRMVPGLAEARFEQAWSGLRPHPVDGLPLIGRMPETENLYVAAGHFRAGLHLSPITARLITQMISGDSVDMPLDAFAPGQPSADD